VLSEVVGGARSWVLHDPGKVLGDIALTLADGGDASRSPWPTVGCVAAHDGDRSSAGAVWHGRLAGQQHAAPRRPHAARWLRSL